MPNKKSKNQKKQAKKKAVIKVVVPKPQRKQKKKSPQKRSQNHSLGHGTSSTMAPPVSMASAIRISHQQSTVLSGTDFIGTVSLPAAAGNSSILGSWLINPITMIPGSRLAQMAECWDKYKFLELEIFSESIQGTNAAGVLCMAMDPDVLDDYTVYTGDVLVQRMSTAPANISYPMWQPISLKPAGKSFFNPTRWIDPNTDSDPRTVYSGRLWVANVGPFSGGNFARLYCRWKVHFEQPALDTSYSDGTAIIQASSGAQISSQYPWGDFSTIIATGTGYIGSGSVVFRSDLVLGSVIQFQAPGFYLININRTGSAMGTGAFSAAVLNGCTYTVTPSMPSINNPYNFSLNNGALTSSSWTAIVEANRAGATISSVTDAGVTHNFGCVFVSKFGNSFTRVSAPAPLSTTALSCKLNELESRMRALLNPPILQTPDAFPSSVFSSSTIETVTETPDPASGVSHTYTIQGNTDVEQVGDVVTFAAGLQKLVKEGYVLIPPEEKKSLVK